MWNNPPTAQCRNRCDREIFVPGNKATTTSDSAETVMDNRDLAEDFQNQFNDVVSRFQSKEFFQSDWDIVSLSVLFIFIGVILMLFILVLIRCCCSCCCSDDEKPQRRKIGIVNMGLQP
ncbi:small integral membrane protein 22 [Takifugu flavidus]|uniref:Small integral membrane protein 22 n=2 Tax=Takifugu TaxID=31032 RepID=A0A5C6NR99_9TELE|nr:small integral membrane protein 22 [Takifugu flavidus]TNM97565.1 hypothetical protein fugu_015721 [Takifugu bimaculatus]TWW69248.1 hypothetical protein D4764_18G0000540 [Takifugu flavidus]